MDDEKKVYLESPQEAFEKGERDQYRESFHENVACANFLKEQINENYKDNSLNTQAVLENTVEEFGVERTKMILALTIQYFNNDGRISRDNKEWASEIPTPNDETNLHQFVVEQSGMIDMLARKLQQIEPELVQQFEKEPEIPQFDEVSEPELLTPSELNFQPISLNVVFGIEDGTYDIAYQVGKFYVEAEKNDNGVEVFLFDSNLTFLDSLEYKTDSITTAINEFCTEMEFDGVGSLRDRSAPAMTDGSLFNLAVEHEALLRAESDVTERAFLNSQDDSFAVFQLKENESTSRFQERGLDFMEQIGEPLNKSNFICVYQGNLDEIMPKSEREAFSHPIEMFGELTSSVINDLQYNDDFVEAGEDLFMGNVIAYQIDGDVSYRFFDGFDLVEMDFPEIPPNFINKTFEVEVLPENLQKVSEIIQNHGGILAESSPSKDELGIINDFAETILSTYNNHAPKEEIVGFICEAFDNAKGEMTMNQLMEVTPEEFIYTFYNEQAPALVENTKELTLSQSIDENYTILASVQVENDEIVVMENKNQDTFATMSRSTFEGADQSWGHSHFSTDKQQIQEIFEDNTMTLIEEMADLSQKENLLDLLDTELEILGNIPEHPKAQENVIPEVLYDSKEKAVKEQNFPLYEQSQQANRECTSFIAAELKSTPVSIDVSVAEEIISSAYALYGEERTNMVIAASIENYQEILAEDRLYETNPYIDVNSLVSDDNFNWASGIAMPDYSGLDMYDLYINHGSNLDELATAVQNLEQAQVLEADKNIISQLSTADLQEMMNSDPDFALSMQEAVAFQEIQNQVEQTLTTPDLKIIREFTDSFDMVESLEKGTTLDFVAQAMNEDKVTALELEEMDLNDFTTAFDLRDTEMLGNMVEKNREINATEVDHSPEVLADIQDSLEETLSDSDLMKINDLITKTDLRSEEHSRPFIQEFVCEALNRKLILPDDVDFLKPSNVENSIHFEEHKQLQGYVESNRGEQREREQEPLAEPTLSPLLQKLQETDVNEVAYKVGENFMHFEKSGDDEQNVTVNYYNKDLNVINSEVMEDKTMVEAVKSQFSFGGFPEMDVAELKLMLAKEETVVEPAVAYKTEDVIASYTPQEDGSVDFQLLNHDLEPIHQITYEDSTVSMAIEKSCADVMFSGCEEVQQGTATEVNLELMALEKEAPRQVNDHYFITDSKVVGDTEVALGQSNSGDTFATWVRNIPADESKGFEANWNFGNYFMEDKESAVEDFHKRIDQYTPEQEKQEEKKTPEQEKKPEPKEKTAVDKAKQEKKQEKAKKVPKTKEPKPKKAKAKKPKQER